MRKNNFGIYLTNSASQIIYGKINELNKEIKFL